MLETPLVKPRDNGEIEDEDLCHLFIHGKAVPVEGEVYKTACGLELPYPNKDSCPHGCQVCVVCADLNKGVPHP